MTHDQLLIPRIIVTNWYPGCPFEEGDILWQHPFGERVFYKPDSPDAYSVYPGDVEKAKKCFRKLGWQEFRKEEDMPMYIRFGKYAAYKVFWDLDGTKRPNGHNIIAWCADKEDYPLHFSDPSQPCTEREYLATKAYFDSSERYTESIPNFIEKWLRENK